MKAAVIRQKWLDFFATKRHKIEHSSSLVPHNDPSLLWINAGMAPLKPYFDGREKPANPRIANAQKCIRTNDIENVGKTRRHHTLFEMLGNFSIGDYFKVEAIEWAWEFLTSPDWIAFDPERLYVTIHPEDEEAYEIWHNTVGLPADRIVKLEDNFWDIGEGPCGPCSEIFYDRGEAYGDLSDPDCTPGGENERYLEVWNLVFSQFNHNKDGSITPLPNKNIDTGAGLERFASILQEVDSNFDTDLFMPLIEHTCQIAGVTYREQPEQDTALKVIADHIRAVSFAIGDGVLPSNEGRGYVLRRLLRRAVRYGKQLGLDKPFMYELVPVLADTMGEHYQEIVDKMDFIIKVVRTEEERFHETLSEGLLIIEEMVRKARQEERTQLNGQEAFKLYDTYGFPLDLTEDYAVEHGLTVDTAGFEQEMNDQRARARAARDAGSSMHVQGGPLDHFVTPSEFVGYANTDVQAKVLFIIADQQAVDRAAEGQNVQVILDRTPFYAESGGQISDGGQLRSAAVTADVTGVSKAPHGQHVHHVQIVSGELAIGDRLQAEISASEREAITKNHTATHLLHKALKQVLGDHVNQAGSLVAVDRLRFDFSHFGSITHEELKQIEQLVNEQIWLNTPVVIEQKPIDEAKAMGAMALFGEKYGDVVRVVQVGGYSIELCGGCHVKQTAEIGLFRILSESGIGSGVRRIEALTGSHAYRYLNAQTQLLEEAARQLKAKPEELPARVEALVSQLKESQRENEAIRAKLSRLEAGSLEEQAVQVGDVTVLTAELKDADIEALRNLSDEMRTKLGSAVVVLASVQGADKVSIVASVTPDLIAKGHHAGKIIKEVAGICGGGGGGRPDMAQAGGKDPQKVGQALKHVAELVAKL